MPTLALLLLGVWVVGCIAADLTARRLPNPLTFGGIAAASAVLLVTGQSALGAPWAPTLAFAAAAALLGVALFAGGVVGAGDVKWGFALVLFAGPEASAATLLFGSLLAGAWALAWLRVAPLAVGMAPWVDARFGRLGLRVGRIADRAAMPLALPYGLAFLAVCWIVATGGAA